jgi:hypothetical protein
VEAADQNLIQEEAVADLRRVHEAEVAAVVDQNLIREEAVEADQNLVQGATVDQNQIRMAAEAD